MEKIKQFILNSKILSPLAVGIVTFYKDKKLNSQMKKKLNVFSKINNTKIFYLGVPAHNNLGDLAQGVCIRKWISKHYPDMPVIEIETNAIVNTHFTIIEELVDAYHENDIIIFQSGYTTTDLGGYADEMHRVVMERIPCAKILMMPQTIYFVKKENKERTSKIYNSMQNMLYLARDEVSYEMALDMFPSITVKKYPDIVTTMIGNRKNDYQRNGIILCFRNDTEKYYSDEELNSLAEKLEKFTNVDRTDTTKNNYGKDVVNNAEKYITQEIDKYAHYKVMITDRYHGTILSLVAGTPVVIIKTTDHKVVTGATWFKGIYDNYVYLAEDLEEAYKMAIDIYKKNLDYVLSPFFEEEYYDKLPKLFKEEVLS